MFTNFAVLRVASLLSLEWFLAGCGSEPKGTASPDDLHDEQQANFAQLSVEDWSLAETRG